MRALLAQLVPARGDIAANTAAIDRVLRSVEGADLAVFGELFLCGYAPERAAGLAIASDGPELRAVAELAARRDTAVVVGFAERTPAGTANAVACIDRDGTLRAVYRKTHLFGAAEEAAFIAGDRLVVVELAGVRVGVLVCFDAEFPEPARALARAGAQLLVTAAANMHPYGADHELAMSARALDNRLPHLYVNRSGTESGLQFCGLSAAITADGHIADGAGADPQVLDVEVDLSGPHAPAIDYLRHVRPDLPVEVHVHSATQGATR